MVTGDLINNLSWPPLQNNTAHEKFKCPCCKKVLINVHQADDCGCRYCYECLDKIFKQNIKQCLRCNFTFASTVLIVY